MPLPIRFNDFNAVQKEIRLNEILEMNQESRQYGLSLSADQASAVISVRNQVLKSYGRIELDISVTKKIIKEFQSSPHILQEDYVEALNTLHEIFYHMKNVTDDRIGDDELIEMIRDSFENTCEGSLELLVGKGLEDITTFYRSSKSNNDDLL